MDVHLVAMFKRVQVGVGGGGEKSRKSGKKRKDERFKTYPDP